MDGLYGEYGLTWGHHYSGYSAAELLTLPRVTTETGCAIDKSITEDIHALNILSLYLDQFKRGWNYTALYLLRDRVDEAGNQQYGLYKPDYTPRKAAVYLHNLTSILADSGVLAKPGKLHYSLSNQPTTAHELLLQKSGGEYDLVVWNERASGSDMVTVRLGTTCPLVKIYDPTLGAAPVRVEKNIRSIPLTLSDHPVVLAFPASAIRNVSQSK